MTPDMTMHQPMSPAPVKATRVQFMAEDDKAMLRAARDLTKGLGEARPGIYWPDMLISAAVGYAGIAVAVVSQSLAVQIAAGLVAAVLAVEPVEAVAALALGPRRDGGGWPRYPSAGWPGRRGRSAGCRAPRGSAAP